MLKLKILMKVNIAHVTIAPSCDDQKNAESTVLGSLALS